MKHIIIGNGNLGFSFAKELLERNETVKILSASNGWRYPTNLDEIHSYAPDHVWVTVGAGSIEQARSNFNPFADLHIRLPVELAQTLNNNVTLHVFSTDYVIQANNLYALSKIFMENALNVINRPKTYIYRVGSLYGTYKPHKCFPYKLKKNSLTNEKISLPSNHICPTPTDWIAKTILNMDKEFFRTYTIAPRGEVSVKEWGEIILKRPLDCNGIDKSRPDEVTYAVCPPSVQSPTWLDLWQEREKEWQEILEKVLK